MNTEYYKRGDVIAGIRVSSTSPASTRTRSLSSGEFERADEPRFVFLSSVFAPLRPQRSTLWTSSRLTRLPSSLRSGLRAIRDLCLPSTLRTDTEDTRESLSYLFLPSLPSSRSPRDLLLGYRSCGTSLEGGSILLSLSTRRQKRRELTPVFFSIPTGSCSMSDPGTNYRTREEVQNMRANKDCIAGLKKYLIDVRFSLSPFPLLAPLSRLLTPLVSLSSKSLPFNPSPLVFVFVLLFEIKVGDPRRGRCQGHRPGRSKGDRRGRRRCSKLAGTRYHQGSLDRHLREYHLSRPL